jgi:hypothetical protein
MRVSVQEELEGLCESPHDSPPEWALMLTAYFDESFQSGNAFTGYTVMAGFYGTKESWVKCAELWQAGLDLHKRKSLHMKDLRWKGDRDKNKAVLKTLGDVPHEAGLCPVFASVRIADYEFASFVPKTFTSGYFLSLVAATSAVLIELPKGQRVELVFEEQIQYAWVREVALSQMRKLPHYKGRRGRSALAGWKTSPKSLLLQPADYLAYAIMQTLINPRSIKTMLCQPILDHGIKRIGGKMSEKQVSRIAPLAKNYVNGLPEKWKKRKH